jgi:5-methylcytosine-specific restriction endonuclease McrA
MALRPCLRCKNLIPKGSYCASCRPRPADPGRLRGAAGVKLRERVRWIYGHRCQHCGAVGVPLEVHHIDHNAANNTLRNLTVLCRPCHARANRGDLPAP